MGVVVVQSSKITMRTFVALSALVAATLAAPTADADAQLLGYPGLAGVGYPGLVGGYAGLAGGYAGLAGGYAGVAPYTAGVVAAPAATYAAGVVVAPAVVPAATYAAAPAVAYAAAPVATVHHTVHQPIVPVHQVHEHVITAPVVRQVGVNVHHQVQHIPQVHVDTKTSHAISTHIINHAPQVGAFIAPGVAALPFAATPALVAAVPAVVAAAPAAVVEPVEAVEAAESA